jgi:uncharacterized protein
MEDRATFIATGYGMEGILPDAYAKRIVNNDIIPNFKEGKYYEGLDAATTTIMKTVSGEYTADGEMENIPWAMIALIVFIFLIVILSRVFAVRKHARVNHTSFWTAWMLMNAMTQRRGRGFSGRGGGFGGNGGFGGFGGGGFGGGGAGGRW